jgi:hypothetical protein
MPRVRLKVIAVALAAVGLSLAPYIVGWITQTETQVFGGFLLDLDDSNSYLAVMQQGMRGEWCFISLYSPEPQHGVWMYTFYMLLGHLVRLTRLSPLAVYHGARVVCGLLLLVVVYRFACFFLYRRAVCWTAFLLVALSSGVGWFSEIFWPTAPGGISPLDFWLLDGYTFLGILTFPHFALAWAALLVAFWAVLAYVEYPRPGYLIVGWVAAFVATAVHPTVVLVIGGVLAVYGVGLWVVERRCPGRWVVGGLPVALGSLMVGLYFYLAFRADPVLLSWSRAVMPSPPPLYFLTGYGLLGPLALAGTVELGRRRDLRGAFLACWVVVAFLLAYAPFGLQRRLIEGVHIPISILAAVGLHRCVLPALARSRPLRLVARLGYPRRRAVWLARSLLIALTWLSNLYLVGAVSLAAGTRLPVLFHSASQMAAFNWLHDNLARDDTLLASYETGNLIPAWTGHRVFVGHWAESANWPERETQVATFFDAATADAWRTAFLRQYGITYIFYGLTERALGRFDPEVAFYLEPVFSGEEVTIYRVRIGAEQSRGYP